MFPDVPTLAVFMAASIALYVSPGPDMLYIASRSVAGGKKAGMISALGTCSGLFVHTLGAALGLSALLIAWPLAYQIVKWLGVAYLAYLGIRVLMDRRGPGFKAPGTQPAPGWWRIYRQGAFVNLMNPKIALFFLAFLPQFVDTGAGAFTAQMLVFGALFTFGGLLWTFFLAMLFGSIGDWLGRCPAAWRWQRRFTGSVLLALATQLALSRQN